MPEPRRIVTALRDARGGRVAVEVDGAPWRELPVDAAARAGLALGVALDGQRLRALAGELRRARAVGTALSHLRRRDLSRGALDERLAGRGIRERERVEALGALERAGLVDDTRAARSRAAALSDRGWGDEAIRHRLSAERLPPDAVEEALTGIEPETARAERLVARRGGGPVTARFLARRGFGEDAVEAAARSSE